MKIAVIDCGTNTFNLLIKNQETGEIHYNDKIPVRLGQGGLEDNTLNEASWQRGLDALHSHKKTIAQLAPNAPIYVMATSAVRSASNGAAFVKAVADETGLKLNVISGDQEAELIFKGVQQGMNLPDAPTLIMDIGGGSSEFILVENQKPVFQASYNIGSSRLMENFRPADPILPEEAKKITYYLETELQDLLAVCQKYQPRILIGSSGSFDTIADMCVQNFKTTKLEPEKGYYTFKLHEYMQIAQRMAEATYDERLHTPGMIPMRADLIVMAHLQINLLVKRLGIKTLQQCNFALKEGLFHSLKANPEKWQKSSL